MISFYISIDNFLSFPTFEMMPIPICLSIPVCKPGNSYIALKTMERETLIHNSEYAENNLGGSW